MEEILHELIDGKHPILYNNRRLNHPFGAGFPSTVSSLNP
jgi:hypothetical protein